MFKFVNLLLHTYSLRRNSMNEQDFNGLVIPLSNKLLKICQVIIGNRDEAKDALQEVFIKLWSNRDRLDGLKSVEAFARSITRNHCLDVLRTKKSTVCIDDINNHAADDVGESNELTLQRIGIVRMAMLELNELQLKVFTMRDIEGMEFDDISSALGLTPENVRVTLSRARKYIRQYVVNKMEKSLHR